MSVPRFLNSYLSLFGFLLRVFTVPAVCAVVKARLNNS